MGISSLGVGSGILTQDVLDQLREADEGQRITPITLNLANENDKKDSLKLIDTTMTNFRDSINELKSAVLFDGRSVSATGSSIEMTASANSDVQDFTMVVDHLAVKQIEKSGAFAASTDLIATDTGTLTIGVGSETPVTIDYDATTTLEDLKKLINDNAGDSVRATILQISDTESQLFLSSVNTGLDNNITITDDSGFLSDDDGVTAGGTFLTALSVTQPGLDNEFTFNGETITRSTNQVDDLIAGYEIKLLEAGSTSVSVSQDREGITTKIDSFVEKYNAIMTEMDSQTVISTDSEVRGIFSTDSTIKGMKRDIQDMITNISGDGGSMSDYGFDVDADGKMSIDHDIFGKALDADADNVEAFFTGGDFTKDDLSVVTLDGAFSDFYDIINGYAKTNGTLDQFKDSITESISTYEDRKLSATERLDAKYEIMKKQYTAYNAIISKFNTSGSFLTQLINSENSSN